MKNLRLLTNILLAGIFILVLSACEKEEVVEPPTAQIFRSIADKQVAFTALTLHANEWQWDFGDGNTSTEKNPVHVYQSGGIYTVTLIARNSAGMAEATTVVQLALTPFEMLTGGASSPNGKTWKISANHSEKDAVALATADFTVIQDVPPGALGLFLGLGEEYDDTFTFKPDGSYAHDNKNGASFGALVFGSINRIVAKVTPASQQFGFAALSFTPEANATFTFTENKDLTITAVSQADGKTTYDVTYEGVSTLNFSGKEFIGLMDFHREVIVQEITPEKMRLVMFMSATQGAHFNKPSLAVVFTFEAVQ